jgi:uncharacterized membrane-anchored protein YjiN (DUF445 family)
MADHAEFRRARRLATGSLLALVAVFVATHLAGSDSAWLGLVRAMAEAGMVGGLADWFAVEALFRRPLGLPIPHTALLPANQARAARNVGRFFEAHFLEPAALEARLLRMEPSRHAADWLARPENALDLARRLVALLGGIARADPPPRLLARIRAWARAAALSAGADAEVADALARGVKQGIRSRLVDEALALIRRAVDDNRETAVQLVQDRSRWWIAARVDRQVAGMAVAGVLSLLDELATADSDLRRRFESAFDAVIDDLAADGVLARAVADARVGLVRSGALDALALRLAASLRDGLVARIETDPDSLAEPLARLVGDLAARLRTDPGARASLDARIAAGIARVVGDLRPALGGYVAAVIADWHPEELIARFEAELGPDLQYIRVNGAVLGALIGGLLYGFGVAFG